MSMPIPSTACAGLLGLASFSVSNVLAPTLSRQQKQGRCVCVRARARRRLLRQQKKGWSLSRMDCVALACPFALCVVVVCVCVRACVSVCACVCLYMCCSCLPFRIFFLASYVRDIHPRKCAKRSSPLHSTSLPFYLLPLYFSAWCLILLAHHIAGRMLSFREFYEISIAPVLIHGDCVHDEIEVRGFFCISLCRVVGAASGFMEIQELPQLSCPHCVSLLPALPQFPQRGVRRIR